MNISLDHPLPVILAAWLLRRRLPKETVVADPQAVIDERKRDVDALYVKLAFRDDTWFSRKLTNILRRYMLDLDRAHNFYKMLGSVALVYVPKKEQTDADL